MCLWGIIYLWSLVLLPVLVTVWKFLILQAVCDLLCPGSLGEVRDMPFFPSGIRDWQSPLQGHAPAMGGKSACKTPCAMDGESLH